MDENAPPLGLSEDEAYDPPTWVRPLVAISVLALAGTTLLLAVMGVALVTGDESTVKAWDYWGNTGLLGALWLVAALLMALGIAVLARRSDDSLAYLLLGVVVLVGTMLWAIVRFEEPGGPALILLVMLVPFLALGGLQMEEPRRWLFRSHEDDE